MSLFGKLVARSRQSASATLLKECFISRSSSYLGSVSFFSSAAPIKSEEYKQIIYGVPPSSTFNRQPTTENLTWRTALLQHQKNDINYLENMLDSLRIARIPPPPPLNNTTSTPQQQQQQQQQQHTFQVMNRNARKAKRANHGKRPCSRVRRRFKVKKW